jgi:hypothetical protein
MEGLGVSGRGSRGCLRSREGLDGDVKIEKRTDVGLAARVRGLAAYDLISWHVIRWSSGAYSEHQQLSVL